MAGISCRCGLVSVRCLRQCTRVALRWKAPREKAKVRHSDMHFLTPIRDYVSRLFWFKLVWVGQAMSDICTILDTHAPSCIAFAARPPRVRGQHSPQFGPAVLGVALLDENPNGSRRERGGHHARCTPILGRPVILVSHQSPRSYNLCSLRL